MKLLRYLFILFPFIAVSQSAPEPYGVLPSERQLDWHALQTYGLIHFTPTTFENKEWGYGDADPSIFNPTDFDPDQIVAAAKSGGLKGLILVAKHHDGFCLWPTKTTEYNISKSPWKNGKGDMVREFEQACRKAGMKFGVYCSPWDRNNAEYGKPAYLETYRAQLKELYTNYGDLFMSWHDGANGGDGYYGGANEKRKIDNTTYYDWTNTWENITRKLQPSANIFSDIGLDVRWVGGEHGYAAETHWATFSPEANTGTVPVPGNVNTDVSSTGTRNGKYWMPAECDVPLRPGWFYHPEEDGKEKDAKALFELYLKSVGRGAGLDLGLAPTKEGKLHENDVKILKEFGEMINEAFQNDLASKAKIKAIKTRKGYHTKALTDKNEKSYWATPDGVQKTDLIISWKNVEEIKYLQIKEYIPLGQRIDGISVMQLKNGRWEKVTSVTSIGANRIIRFEEPIHTNKIKLTIEAAAPICLSQISVY
ncbi:MAG: alpha-L-fucosidase [Cytophagales bacterium]|nr:alpha-L-fucosidase [Cytophagales bacterium]